jgi:hypothetical protein
VDVALREGDLDACLAEGLVDGLVQLVPGRQKGVDAGDEDPQLEVQRAVPEAEKEGPRRRIVEHVLAGTGNIQQELRRLLRV